MIRSQCIIPVLDGAPLTNAIGDTVDAAEAHVRELVAITDEERQRVSYRSGEALEAGVVEKMVSVVERLLASTEADTDEVARAEEAARALLQQIKGGEHD